MNNKMVQDFILTKDLRLLDCHVWNEYKKLEKKRKYTSQIECTNIDDNNKIKKIEGSKLTKNKQRVFISFARQNLKCISQMHAMPKVI